MDNTHKNGNLNGTKISKDQQLTLTWDGITVDAKQPRSITEILARKPRKTLNIINKGRYNFLRCSIIIALHLIVFL